MAETIRTHVCVIGAGSAGLSVAAGTAQLGLDTVIVEPGPMGGDCLNTGCVPSKAMLAVARQAHGRRTGGPGSLPPAETLPERKAVDAHIRETIATIAPHDSVERFEKLGCRVVRAPAFFVDEHRIMAGNTFVRAEYFVIAAGSSPAIPAIAGLDPERVLTNETIFDIETRPEHLVVIGAGPIGVEMAQAHRRLGSRVTLIDAGAMLPRDEPELVDPLRQTLREEGVTIREHVAVKALDHRSGAVDVTLDHEGSREVVSGSHCLVATGRRPNLFGLGLEQAGIETTKAGIRTDRRMRTTNKRIFAIGDIAGGPQFTHVAGYHGGIVVRNIAFRMPARVDYRALPWVTFTDPEMAHVGLSEAEAREKYGDLVRTLVHPLKNLDRAVAEGRREGTIKLVATRRGKVLGCSILAPGAGEMIGLWGLAITRGLFLRDIAGLILPYPTFGEASKQAASAWYTPQLFADRTRSLVRWLQYLPRW